MTLLAAAIAACSSTAAAATEAERIEMLEAQLARQAAMMAEQQKMLEAMQAEMRSLRAQGGRLEESLVAREELPRYARQTEEAAGLDFQLYGHMQLDAIYDFKRVDPTWESTLRPSTIPIEEGQFGDDGVTVVSVKQTQQGFRASLPTAWGDAKFWFEYDFFGTGSDAGDTKFNLRHAWVEVGGLSFGQTNSNFMDISIFPNVIDWWGPSGMAFNRNPQVRYTFSGEGSELAFALEKPNGSFNTGIFGDESPEFDEAARAKTPLPDLTAHWRNEFDWGHYQVAGVLRQLEFETLGTDNNNPKDSELGWGVNLTSVINTVGRDQLKLGLVYGEGIASFFNDGGVNLAPDNNQAKAVEVMGITAYYDHYWNKQFSTSIGWSTNNADPTNQQAGFEFDTSQYASVNLLWTPYPSLLIGSEFLWGNLEVVDGRDEDDYRIQFSFKHKFGFDF
ncbi:MAG: DcaP family trimeric outer membrane transporter [Halieaceae bacterium]|jgi:hypothetical protein|nr:DcaP family trimeric outer membrane transporter [Halieaceae bacterium]